MESGARSQYAPWAEPSPQDGSEMPPVSCKPGLLPVSDKDPRHRGPCGLEQRPFLVRLLGTAETRTVSSPPTGQAGPWPEASPRESVLAQAPCGRAQAPCGRAQVNEDT